MNQTTTVRASKTGRATRKTMSFATAALALLSVGAVLPLLCTGFVLDNDALIYAAISFLAGAIPLVAGLSVRKEFDIFEPINLAAIAIIFGSAVRSIWLMTSSSDQVDFLMMQTTFPSVAQNLPLIFLGVVCFTFGYMMLPRRAAIERLKFLSEFKLSQGRLYVALIASLIVTVIGIVLSFREYGIEFNGNILAASTKRVTEIVDESGDTIYGIGVARFIGQVAEHGFLILASALVARLVKPSVISIGMLGLLFLVSSIIPIVTSSRTSLILMFMSVVIVMNYYNRLSVRSIVIGLVLSLTVITVLGNARQQNQAGAEGDQSTIDLFVGSGHGVDFVRTSAIMDRVPEKVGFQNGATYLGVFSFLPRSMWPDKPDISLGAFVKGKVFGEFVRVNGWPPGAFAEAWINFGAFGMTIPMFLLGFYLRYVYETVRPMLGVSFPVTVIWGAVSWSFAFNTMNLNFAQGFWQTINTSLPLVILLVMAKAPTKSRSSRGSGPSPMLRSQYRR